MWKNLLGIFLQAVMAVWRAEMYQEYIDGTKEIRDINMEFNAHYIREDLDEKLKRSCPM